MARIRSTAGNFEDIRSEISNSASIKGLTAAERKAAATSSAKNLVAPDIPAFDVISLPPVSIRKYRAAYKLPGSSTTPSSSASSLNGIQKRSSVGMRACAGNALQKHFDSMHIPKEHEIAARFLYRVKTQDRELRVRFGPS
ncbi:hypothetical protein NEOLI_003574 [Neolecta irregularis DAH-3]|uniref:Histone deacetylase complex subunit SAP30 Sin3 binding domain-containing protein n=1 Tax=Neolecta irregularis (strain DAH-3) TaxID=1198029 RepID=A0A1U7LSN2_NEOID|nr:hypothetical protein NEOLI_003574 [Neolecta irregularis DAH-3]|eukprot:OLL25552.1 hypothetical protein NEOLI_003574 [Neolecta irregularis DAH-3]